MLIVVLLSFLGYFAVCAAIGYLIFSPFKDILARDVARGRHFQITDLLAIVFSYQVIFSLIKLAFPDARWTTETNIVVAIVIAVITIISWLYGLRIIWRADIRGAKKRVVLLGVVVPFGILISAAAFFIVLVLDSAASLVPRCMGVLVATVALRYLGIWTISDRTERKPETQEDLD